MWEKHQPIVLLDPFIHSSPTGLNRIGVKFSTADWPVVAASLILGTLNPSYGTGGVMVLKWESTPKQRNSLQSTAGCYWLLLRQHVGGGRSGGRVVVGCWMLWRAHSHKHKRMGYAPAGTCVSAIESQNMSLWCSWHIVERLITGHSYTMLYIHDLKWDTWYHNRAKFPADHPLIGCPEAHTPVI